MKKCIVEFDEFHEPINVVEIKEFRTSRDLQNFIKECTENRAKSKARYDAELAKERKEKSELEERLSLAEGRIEVLQGIVMALLGKIELTSEEIDKILEGF